MTAQPTLYGMWMFAFTTWQHARLVTHQRLQLNDTLNATKSWTLVDEDGNLVVLLIRKDQRAAAVMVTIRLSGVQVGYDANSVEVSAPSVTSKSGLSMAGLTWDGTTDGLPVPTAAAESAGYLSTKVSATVQRSDGSDDVGGGSETVTASYEVSVRPASVLAVVIPTSDDQGRSLQRRVSTVLRVKSATTSPVVSS